MSWTDGISDSDSFLPFFGIVGCLVLAFILIFNYCQHKDIMRDGVPMTIVDIGTCRDGICIIKVQQGDSAPIEKSTGSKVFIGDTVMCGSNTCYKD